MTRNCASPHGTFLGCVQHLSDSVIGQTKAMLSHHSPAAQALISLKMRTTRTFDGSNLRLPWEWTFHDGDKCACRTNVNPSMFPGCPHAGSACAHVAHGLCPEQVLACMEAHPECIS